VKLLVLGAGAVGLGFAARLSTVADVTAITREKPAKEISEKGLILTGAWGNGTYRFPCMSEPPLHEHFDYILVTTKAHDTRHICSRYSGLFEGSDAVSLQNGLGSAEAIAAFSGRVIGAVVMSGFVREDLNRITITANAGESLLGRFPEGIDHPVGALAALMDRAGIPARADACIKSQLWSKNLISCALNPISALLGVRYGLLTSDPGWHIISGIAREVFLVADAEGVPLLWGNPDKFLNYLKHDLIPAMASHSSSMLEDLRHGRKTEIDFMNGAIVSFGKKHGIATPYNECLTNFIKFREEENRETGLDR
jgi:2-dehydropantoate 2-reductase